VQPNTIHALLSNVELTFDLQNAFRSVPQPATASIRGVLCSANGAFYSFSHEMVTNTWHYHGEGSSEEIGAHWEQVVSKCSLARLKPALLLYQVESLPWACHPLAWLGRPPHVLASVPSCTQMQTSQY
jgi:hypothetical protein